MKSAALASVEIPELKAKLDKVLQTPASFGFFVAIHDFVEHLEAQESFSQLTLPASYQYLRQVHQGIKDTKKKPAGDIGHDRYMVIQELIRIREDETPQNNSLWKRSDNIRRISADIYKTLTVSVAKPK